MESAPLYEVMESAPLYEVMESAPLYEVMESAPLYKVMGFSIRVTERLSRSSGVSYGWQSFPHHHLLSWDLNPRLVYFNH